jgi:hypothetical protein
LPAAFRGYPNEPVILERCFAVVPYPLDAVRRALTSDLDAWLPAALFDAAHTRHALIDLLELDDLQSSEPEEHPPIQIGEIQEKRGGCVISMTWNPPGAEHVFGSLHGQLELLSVGTCTLLAFNVTYHPSRGHLGSWSTRLKIRYIFAMAGRSFLDIAERSVRVTLDPRWTNSTLPASP